MGAAMLLMIHAHIHVHRHRTWLPQHAEPHDGERRRGPGDPEFFSAANGCEDIHKIKLPQSQSSSVCGRNNAGIYVDALPRRGLTSAKGQGAGTSPRLPANSFQTSAFLSITDVKER